MRLLQSFLPAIALTTFFATASVAEDVVHVDRNNEALPAVEEFAKQTGDATKGAASFAPLCGICHQVNGAGIDFGPNLSDVGSRKTKAQILESILEPSKVIEQGFENYMIKLEGDQVAMGFIASENDDEIVVKAMGGVKTTYKKADVLSRTKQAMSLMPAGLNRALSKEDLLNIAEYLFAQKAKQ